VQIKRVHIENFRSIKALDFEPGSYAVLIGENNAGKSNVLRAINLVLGEIWPSERSFSEEDFFNQDTSKDIVIQVFVDTPWEEWRNKFKMTVAGFELRCHALQRKSGKKLRGELSTEYVCIDQNGKHCTCPAETGQYKGMWIPLRVSSDFRERLPFIYVGVLREYDKQNPTSRWSVLRKLLNEVNIEFTNDKKPVEVIRPDGTKVKISRKEAFESAVKDAYKYLRTDKFIDLEKRLAANVIDQMGVDPGEGDVSLHFESHDPTHAFKSLQLYVDQLGISSPAAEVGAGLQSAIVVGIFRTYEELKKDGAVFAIEEPEVFLHPQKARYFQTVLQKIASADNQVLVTTHSPIFVQLHQPEAIALVRRNNERGTTITQNKKVNLVESDRQALRLLTEFDAQRNELFFAKKVFLVEGNTEKIAVPLALRALGHDVNKLGISVIECGGKTKMPLFLKAVKSFGIPYVALADEDIKEPKPEWSEKRQEEQLESNKKHAQWNKELQTHSDADRLFWMKPDFEGENGLPSNESEKVDKALEMFSAIKQEQIPKSLVNPIQKLLS
jgi:putative ATP-dependent endonuclease of OLD family